MTVFAGAALIAPMAACAQQVPRSEPVVTPSSQPGTEATKAGAYAEGSGNEWFDRTRADFGTFFEEETAKGRFKFANPRGIDHKLTRLTPSCACSKAIVRIGDRQYEVGSDKVLRRIRKNEDGTEIKERVSHIEVGADEEGDIEVHMKMTGIRGPREADLNIQTSDEELPIVGLKWRATGAVFFSVEPPEVNLNEMTWTDEREFEFRIRSPLKKDFNLISHEPLVESMKVTYEKEMDGDAAVWVVKGTYGPGARERDQGGSITFTTDIGDKADQGSKKVTARVIAFLKGPLTMKPGGFVALGHVKRDEGKQVEVRLIPTGDFDLQVERLETGRLRIKEDQKQFLKFEHHKDGKDVIVVIKVGKGMKPAYVNGILKIHLNHPAVRMKEVMFNGFVR